MGIICIVAALSSLGPIARAQPRHTRLEDPDWVKPLLSQRIVYAVPGMEQVSVRSNVVYKRAGDIELKMDVYSPRGEPDTRRAALVFIHGGPIPANPRTGPKDWGPFVSYGQLAAASGFIGITFNHRFYGWDNLSQANSDVADLIAYVRSNAPSLGVDQGRIALWVFSGGGPLLSQPLRDSPDYLRCVISYYALLDLLGMRAEVPASITDETLRDFSPVNQLGTSGRRTAPILIARAGLDGAGLNRTVDRFVQEALTKNIALELLNHPEGHHSFDIDDDNERSREIIKRTIEFIKAHAGP